MQCRGVPIDVAPWKPPVHSDDATCRRSDPADHYVVNYVCSLLTDYFHCIDTLMHGDIHHGWPNDLSLSFCIYGDVKLRGPYRWTIHPTEARYQSRTGKQLVVKKKHSAVRTDLSPADCSCIRTRAVEAAEAETAQFSGKQLSVAAPK